MKAFYCDHFVLPLPPAHTLPMLKYARLREKIVADGIVCPDDLVVPEAVDWADLYLEALDAALETTFRRQDPDFVFYLAGADPYRGDRLGRLARSIEGLRERDRCVCARARNVPVAVAMGGGYCPDVETIVAIHANTIREAGCLHARLVV